MNTIGFDFQKKVLKNYLESESPSGSFLFYGQEMIGKKTLAMELAEYYIKKEKGSTAHDLLYINSAESESGQNISIDEIREVKRFLSLSPIGGRLKFVIIDNAHEMQEEAQNAILKIIEEPPSFAVVILISHKTDTILPTIISRCQKIYFPAHSPGIIRGIIKESSPGLNDKQIKFISEFSNGKIGMVFKMLEEKSFGDIKKSAQKLSDLISADISERFSFAADIADKSKSDELKRSILYWFLYLRPKFIDYINSKNQNDNKNAKNIARMAKGLLRLQYVISNPHYNKRLALENFVLSL